MSRLASVDDLRLVVAVHRHGSVGAAARELLITQPSASARLAALERTLSVRLFDRDTTGARATPAGIAFATEAEHILAHLAALPERTLAGARAPVLRVATFPSLGALLFSALDTVLAQNGIDVVVSQLVDHGDRLIDLVAEGSLDVAVVGIAAQRALPHGVTATRLGADRLAAFLPAGVPAPTRRRRPFAGEIPYHSVDLSGPAIEQRIGVLGGRGRRAATGEVAILTARRAGAVALVSRAIAAVYLAPGERIHRSPVAMSFSYDLITRTPLPGVVDRIRRPLAEAMGLERVRGEAR